MASGAHPRGGCLRGRRAVFDRAENRALIEEAARKANVPFTGVWLQADASLLWRRVSERRNGVSDATIDVLSQQLQRDQGNLAWTKLEAAAELEATVSRILGLSGVGDPVADAEKLLPQVAS